MYRSQRFAPVRTSRKRKEGKHNHGVGLQLSVVTVTITMRGAATVGGGCFNKASGGYVTVAGGNSNTAAGWHSFAGGRRAIIAAAHDGAFLWADWTDLDFNSEAAD